MKKTLCTGFIITILAILIGAKCFGQGFTPTFQKVKLDSIAGRNDTIWITDEAGSKAYLFTRNDTLFLNDAGGEKPLAGLTIGGAPYARDSVYNYEVDSGLARLTDIIPYPDLTQNENVNIDAGYLNFTETSFSNFFRIAPGSFSSGYYTTNVGNDINWDYNTFGVQVQDWTNSYYADIKTEITENTSGEINLFVTDPLSDETRIDLHTTNGITITDAINSRGLVGAADYSSNYNSNTYIQKVYADNNYASATAPGNNNEIILNNNGAFGASSNLKFKNDTLYVNGDVYITTGSCFVDTSGVIYYLDSDGMYVRNLNTNNSVVLGDAGLGLSVVAADNEINLDAQTYIEYESSIDHLFTINSDSILKLNDDSVIFYRNAQTPFDWTLYGYDCGYLTFDRNQTIETYRNVILRTYNSSNGAQLLLIDDTGGGKEASLYVLNSGSKQNGVYIDVNKVRIGSAYSTAMADFTTSLIDFNISTEIDGSLGVTDTSVYNISYVQIDGDAEYEHAQAAVHPATANAAIYTAINIPQMQFGNAVIIKQITIYYYTDESGDDWDFHLYSSDNDGTITSHVNTDDIGNGETGNSSVNLLSSDETLTDYSYTMEFDINNTNLDTDVLFYNVRIVYTNK